MSAAGVTPVLGAAMVAAVAGGIWLALTWHGAGAGPVDAPPRQVVAAIAAAVVAAPAPQRAGAPAPQGAAAPVVVSKRASPFGIVPKGTVVEDDQPAPPSAGAQAVPRRLESDYPRHSGR
ncbi:hypothetical protein [Massilia glaciei]|uniref:Uncharacterized protein n=1 Tax=Massilia glaciei TaxID=1524097 RepID=A0A2U2HES4_9BURK|nr:hypothetical protein [Massilia glaciei]PWF42268.1 hypothetical protein C7C56_023075 [Massilia glaciei]